MFILTYTQDGRTRRHALTPGDTIVGRAPVCDLVIDDPSISRRHARFRVHGEYCVLSDLGGRNGTFVNGERVTEAEVHHGDSVVLGRFALRIDRDAAAPVELSDSHALVDTAEFMARRVDTGGETMAGVGPGAPAERLALLLSAVADHLIGWQPLPDLLQHVVDAAFAVAAVERVFLLLIDERSGEVVPQVSRMRDGSPLTHASLRRATVQRAISQREAMVGSDALLGSATHGADAGQSTIVRSFVCVPLWTGRDVLGVLYADNPRLTRLGPSDLEVMQLLAACAAGAIDGARRIARHVDELRRRERLQRHYPPPLVDRMLSQDADTVEPVIQDVTVLAADLSGLGPGVLNIDAGTIAATLTMFVRIVAAAVFAEEGTIDRFSGDTAIAVFGAPVSQPDHATRAARAARRIRQQVSAIDSLLPLRIALHSGRALVGDVGPPDRRDYTVFGEAIDTCARILGLARKPGGILLSAATQQALGSEPTVVHTTTAGGVEIFELAGDASVHHVQNE